MIMIFWAPLFFWGLYLLKKYTDKGFYIAQVIAFIIAYTGIYGLQNGLGDYIQVFTIMWVFASLAAMVVPNWKNSK